MASLFCHDVRIGVKFLFRFRRGGHPKGVHDENEKTKKNTHVLPFIVQLWVKPKNILNLVAGLAAGLLV